MDELRTVSTTKHFTRLEEWPPPVPTFRVSCDVTTAAKSLYTTTKTPPGIFWNGLAFVTGGFPSGHTLAAMSILAYNLGDWTPAIRSVFGLEGDHNPPGALLSRAPRTVANAMAMGR